MIDRYARILPPDLVSALTQLGREMRKGAVDPTLVSWIVDRCGALPLRRLEETSYAIRTLADRYAVPALPRRRALLASLLGPPERGDLALLRKTPGLDLVFLVHGSGWIREPALRKLDGPAPSAFWMAILAHRLNDWVPQVRTAAVGAFDRVAVRTPPAVLARTFVALLARTNEWSRWTVEADLFRALPERPGVKDEIVSILMEERDGPLGKTLRRLLKEPDYDAHLVLLARSARHSAVRAVALETLLFGRARWLAGRQRKWVDKTIGLWRLEPCFESRTVQPQCSFDELVQIGMDDKASAVRKVVAAALVERPELASALDETAQLLANDSNPGIRERAEFVLSRLREAV